jgi:hypothetical protein
MIDEAARRQPYWTEAGGDWIDLGAAGRWCLPAATVAARPIVGERRMGMFAVFRLGECVDSDDFSAVHQPFVEMLAELSLMLKADPVPDAWWSSAARLAAFALVVHYDLAPDEALGLVRSNFAATVAAVGGVLRLYADRALGEWGRLNATIAGEPGAN